MALIKDYMPPSRENYEWVLYFFGYYFPLFSTMQWVTSWYGAGKTSADSRFNIPGKIAWLTMEAPGFCTLLYIMNTLPAETGLASLPLENKIMGSLFVIHYIYRALICPFLNPSMAPIHPFVWLSALTFQLCNGTSIGCWLAGYGPTTRAEWQKEANYKAAGRMMLGIMIWALGLGANIWHDDELREIRRAAARNQKKQAAEADPSTGKGKSGGKGVEKVYMIPQNGFFTWILYPHYLCEWIEWAGFWMVGGLNCVPARNFLMNEIFAMLPRAVSGKKWYVDRFGKEKVGNRKAIIPGILIMVE